MLNSSQVSANPRPVLAEVQNNNQSSKRNNSQSGSVAQLFTGRSQSQPNSRKYKTQAKKRKEQRDSSQVSANHRIVLAESRTRTNQRTVQHATLIAGRRKSQPGSGKRTQRHTCGKICKPSWPWKYCSPLTCSPRMLHTWCCPSIPGHLAPQLLIPGTNIY